MNKKFVVSYQIDYIHWVSVGIEAVNEREAQQLAEPVFNWLIKRTLPTPGGKIQFPAGTIVFSRFFSIIKQEKSHDTFF